MNYSWIFLVILVLVMLGTLWWLPSANREGED